MFVPVPKGVLAGSGRQLYRISTTWVSDSGASRITQPPGYLYVTPLPLTRSDNGESMTDGTGPSEEPHQGRGIARRILTTGPSLLAAHGCGRFKVSNDLDLYLKAAFRPVPAATAGIYARQSG